MRLVPLMSGRNPLTASRRSAAYPGGERALMKSATRSAGLTLIRAATLPAHFTLGMPPTLPRGALFSALGFLKPSTLFFRPPSIVLRGRFFLPYRSSVAEGIQNRPDDFAGPLTLGLGPSDAPLVPTPLITEYFTFYFSPFCRLNIHPWQLELNPPLSPAYHF